MPQATPFPAAPAAAPDLLLHICCGPCSTACIERLRSEGHEPALAYINDNIDTPEEWERRLSAAETVARAAGVRLLVPPRDAAAWEADIRGLEDEPEGGARCRRCFLHSFRRAIALAAEQGLPLVASSLTVSPHKRSATVFDAGAQAESEARAAAPGAPRFAPFDFKKKGGFLRSIALARELGLYRQNYCGCRFSRRQDA